MLLKCLHPLYRLAMALPHYLTLSAPIQALTVYHSYRTSDNNSKIMQEDYVNIDDSARKQWVRWLTMAAGKNNRFIVLQPAKWCNVEGGGNTAGVQCLAHCDTRDPRGRNQHKGTRRHKA